MRTCRTCGVEKELAGFTVRTSGRIECSCKVCAGVAQKLSEAKNSEKRKAYLRMRRQLPHVIARTKARWQTPAGKATKRKSDAKQDPIKRAARNKVTAAVRRGRLVRQPCESCGDIHTHGHHDDYNKPLEVRWLCDTHHKEWHKHNTPISPNHGITEAGSRANNTGRSQHPQPLQANLPDVMRRRSGPDCRPPHK